MHLTPRRQSAFAFAILPAVLLAACGKDDAPADARPAQGAVLDRTITDDMLPLFESRAQPPYEIEAPADALDPFGDADTGPADSEDPADPAGAAAPTIAPSPAEAG